MTTEILSEDFDTPHFDNRLSWRCPPSQWSIAHSLLTIAPDGKTDYWQKTHYGFEADNGHFLFIRQEGDFMLYTNVRFFPKHQYDQAGLMVRSSSQCWLKTSVEFEPDGPGRLGVVATNAGYSDWSMQDFSHLSDPLALRIRREKNDFSVEYALLSTIDASPKDWNQIRLAHLHLPESATIECGLYACSPKESGFRADFGFLRVEKGM
jgi:regulation of enolase protein 1 (concanavalin A-like superfamily)